MIFLLKGIRSSDPKLLAFMIVEAVCTVVTPYLGMYLPKFGVDLVTEQADPKRAVFLLGGITAVMAISQMAGTTAQRAQTMLHDLCAAIIETACLRRPWNVIMNM